MIYVFAPTFPTTAIDTSIYCVGKTLGEVGRIYIRGSDGSTSTQTGGTILWMF